MAPVARGIAAAATPFVPGSLEIDEVGLRRNLRHWIDDLKIDGLFIAGKQGKQMAGYLVRPAKAAAQKLPAIVVVHENRGLNPHIADVARRTAAAGFIAFAPDALFPLGGYPGTDDEGRTMQVLGDSQARGDNVYFLFIGACEHSVEFKFLNTIADRFKNTGVVIVRDLEAFVEQTDEQISAQLLGPELIGWLKK